MDGKGPVRPMVLNSPLDPTRARPEPWFVGNGRGLMIGIISLCVVLLIARGLTMVWMAEAAWDWLKRPAPPRPVLMPPPAPAVSPEQLAPPAPPAPPGVADRPVARVRGNPGAMFGRDMYPVEALRRGEQGRVVARLAIDRNGRPTGCSVVETSRSASLDRVTCTIGATKLRFLPASDRIGRPVLSRYDLRVRWVLEE